MAFGLGVLRWSPDAFWGASPRELIAAANGLRGGAPVTSTERDDLARLMRMFPD